MQLLHLMIENLRSIQRLDLDLSAAPGVPRRRVVLLGANGAGKTTLLDALAHAFQAVGSDSGEFGAEGLKAGDVRNVRAPRFEGEEPPRHGIIEMQAHLTPEERQAISPFYPAAPDRGRIRSTIGGGFLGDVLSAMGGVERGADANFVDSARAALLGAHPPCILLPAKRGVLEPRTDVMLGDVMDFNPRRECLSRDRSRFNALSARLALAYAGDKRADPSGAVGRMWKVLAKYFPELPRPVSQEGLVLQFETQMGALVPLGALSDGERALLLMFGEIALRAPQHGIVLIDEVEQHLHPRWQRAVAEALAALVPTAQFFLTTQSPYLAASVPDDVIKLGDWEHHGE